MKISAAAILILCVVIDQKATVQGGFLDRLRGKDKTPDEALDGSAFSGGLSGNLKLPGNILSECSVGGNMNGNIGASTSGGIEGNVNAGVNLPSCDCIRKFDTQESVGGGGSAGFGGFGVNGGASFSGSLAMPGMNCVESDNPPEEETDEKQDPPEEQEFSEDEDSPEEEEESSEEEEEEVDITTLPLCADLRRQDLQGSLGGTDTSSKVAPGNRNNDNVFEKISVIIPGVNCYEPEPPEEKSEESTEAPEESEESTEALEESEKSEESTEAPEESEESTEALEESEKSEESTEAPEESEESTEAPEESEESTEAPEESEESTEAPEESEESTEALEESEKSEESTEEPEESEESTEAPEESEESTEAPEESEESTEAPEESEESTEAPEESEESEESTEEPEEAPEKNSYCYRIDIDRDIIISPQNDFLTASAIGNEDSPATFYQTMNMDNALQFYSAIIFLDKNDIYDSKPEKKMTNVCDDSYPEGSIEANIWKIINLEVMAGEGCPVQRGTGHTFRQWLRGTELMFNEPLEYGNYTLYADFDTPQGAWALKLGFDFVVDENSECTAGENFDESTETPRDLEKSKESEEESEQCYIVDVDVNVVKLPIFMKVLNKPMDKDNAFIINGAAVKTNDETIYDSKSEKEMTNACEDSYPEGSFQANIWHLFNLEILKGKGCPAKQGSINSFPSKLNDTQLKINKRLEPGEYYVNLDLSAPDGTWAGATYFNFMLDSPSECKEEGEPQEPVEGESNFNCYKVDIRRSSLLVPTNDFLKAPQINGDITAIFYQTMDMNNPLQFFRADVFGNNKRIYGLEESEKQMKSACDDSYPEGSFEANIWKIFNLSIMNGQGCPVEEGNHTFIWWLRETELYFDNPLEYGNYTVHVDFDTPQGDWALGLYFDFVVNENSTCTNS
ncbi:hypothetical protein G9C98_000524 [Cotesia typhae]|uniref:Uncharacterized protein n=1 Tax=Cotesia typhae TaxID=2053667 RepID=A0A8J5UVW5_9HYME|nr:hypothetical protein G9C98_000524 [Cotesia typhae]